jgi:hypothetical protein
VSRENVNELKGGGGTMKTRFVAVVLAVVCMALGWKLWAKTQEQQQQQVPMYLGNQDMAMSDADIQLLRQDLRAQKQKLIAQNLPMTESEAIKFWAVYNKYTQDLRDINDEKYRLIKEYGEQWPTMTNDQALIYIRRWLEVDDQAHQLRTKYVPAVSQALPGKKAATFFQLDRRISMMIDMQLSSQIPLAGKDQ